MTGFRRNVLVGAAFVWAATAMVAAAAGEPPEAVTGQATKVTSVSAVLHGTVNPHGAKTTFYFEYGNCEMCASPTAPYTGRTPVHSAGHGTKPRKVAVKLTGLASGGPPYHYRLVATNDAGKPAFGEDRTFVAPSPWDETPTKVSPSHGSATTTFEMRFSSRAELGAHGLSYSSYSVQVTGPQMGARCARGADATLDSGSPGDRIRLRLAPPAGQQWCVGTFEGKLFYEHGPYCPPSETAEPRPCPMFASQMAEVGHFSFRVGPRSR